MASPAKMGRTVSESFDATGTAAGGTHTGLAPLTSHGIWVAVRVRPFNKRELQESQTTGEMGEAVPTVELERDNRSMTLLDPSKGYQERGNYHFDYCFSAFRPSVELEPSPHDSDEDEEEELAEKSQAAVYRALGQPIVASAWQGYNGCIFAYGQTSSGKTYTMMGTKRDPGVIPRLCRELFEKIEDDDNTRKMKSELDSSSGEAAAPVSRKMTKVTVSYMEIYNEQVKDLLKSKPKGPARPKFTSRFDTNAEGSDYEDLRVRQHPLHGPFVEGLMKVDVNNWLDCVRIIRQGNEKRSTTGTAMNDASSRSHAIFQLVVTQTESLGARVRGKEVTNHRVSKINLVDLAGSERITKSNVTGKHITEANFINKSLSTLRKVIDVLVTTAKKKAGGSSAPVVVPYRESLLTWILSDNFGGNSKTAMIANVSPHFSCWHETESTLRYATLAKGIVNRIRVNEDPSAKLIRELQTQLKALQAEMQHGPGRERELEEQMEENKRAMEELLAREEGMRKLIQESRTREAKLRAENESLATEQSRWKQEAEKLKKEKEELRSQLIHLAEEGKLEPSVIPQERKSSGFWASDKEDDASPHEGDIAANEEESCPPQSSRPHRPASALSVGAMHEEPSSSVHEEPQKPATSSKPKDDSEPAFLQEEDDDAAPTQEKQPASKAHDEIPALARRPESGSVSSMILPVANSGSTSTPSGTPPSPAGDRDGSVSPSVRYGRRAVTEEGKEREVQAPVKSEVRTAEQRPRRNRGMLDDPSPTGSQPAGVPISLQHLVGPSPTGGPQASSPAFSKPSNGQADALDAFLAGGGTSGGQNRSAVDRRKDRPTPPWRQKR